MRFKFEWLIHLSSRIVGSDPHHLYKTELSGDPGVSGFYDEGGLLAEYIGKRAVVIGAGMAGLPAARVLSDFFEKVILLESDTFPSNPVPRSGTPQSKHLHALLAGGERALTSLFPGFVESLVEAGAQQLPAEMALRKERPGFAPFPFRDLGFCAYSATRPLVEWVLRRRVAAIANVEIRQGSRAQHLLFDADKIAATGVSAATAAGSVEEMAADLVLDCSSHGQLTLNLLTSLGLPAPHEDQIGMDMGYATGVFAIPDDAPTEWKGVVTYSDPPRNRLGAFLMPVEGGEWIVSIGGSHNNKPGHDESGYLESLQRLRTPTIYNAVLGAKRRGSIERYGLKASRWRHFERLSQFPARLLPFGDTICRFNPVYGQGMSVAAKEAVLLQTLLREVVNESFEIENLAIEFLSQAQTLIDAPWWQAAIPDLLDPLTIGARPADLADSLRFGAALAKLAYRDAEIHKLMLEVQHLLKPRSMLRTPEILALIQAEVN